jgi:hypothetical protein
MIQTAVTVQTATIVSPRPSVSRSFSITANNGAEYGYGLPAIAGTAYHGARFQYAARGHRGSPILSMDPAVASRLVAPRDERCLRCPREVYWSPS